MLWASSASGDYPVFIGTRLLGRLDPPVPGRSFCVTDSDVGALYAERIAARGDAQRGAR